MPQFDVVENGVWLARTDLAWPEAKLVVEYEGEYHFDGLRLDSIHDIYDESPVHILKEVIVAAETEAAKLGRPVHVIAETHDSLPRQSGMQIAPEQAGFLTLMTKIIRVRHAVEVGTFTGYSSLAIARGLAEGGTLLCCDVSEEWTAIAQRYWKRAGVDDRIQLKIAPAIETLRGLPQEVYLDLAFIDADKTGYRGYYEACLKLLRAGGLIAVDNTLWSGRVADPGVGDEDTVALRAFNVAVARDERHCRGESLDVQRIEQGTRRADHLRQRAAVRRDHGNAGGHRFERRNAKALVEGWHHQGPCARVQALPVRLGYISDVIDVPDERRLLGGDDRRGGLLHEAARLLVCLEELFHLATQDVVAGAALGDVVCPLSRVINVQRGQEDRALVHRRNLRVAEQRWSLTNSAACGSARARP